LSIAKLIGTKSRRIILILCLYTLTITANLSATHWKIMPVGNSLTYGYPTEPGFREALHTLLTEAGIDFEFVGPDGIAPLNGLFVSGAKIEDFYAGNSKDLSAAIATYKPNLLLMHVGTNNYTDVAAPYSPDNGITLLSNTSSGKLAKLLKQFSTQSSLEHILLCKIISQINNGVLANIQVEAYNSEIERMFFDRASGIAVDKMTIVDMYSQLDITDYYDEKHPDQGGYDKMAQEYSRIVQGINNNDMNKPGKIAWIRGEVLDKQTGTIQLQWKAPGDDAYYGKANLYELRYAEYELADFSDGILVPGLDAPKSANSTETKIISGLIPGITYHFYIRAWDEMNNKGAVSDEYRIYVEPDVVPEYTDNFADPVLSESWWDFDPAYEIINEQLVNTNPATGWDNLATYKRVSYNKNADYIETSFKFIQFGDGGAAMMLDDTTSTANGYFVFIRSNRLRLFAVTNGSIQTAEIYSSSISNTPQAGDVMIVQCYPNTFKGVSFEVSVYNEVNGTRYVGNVWDVNKTQGNADNLYSGVLLYGGQHYAIDDFSVKIPPLPAHKMAIYAGNNESGRVTKKLANSLTVQVTDVNGLAVSDVPIDFNVTSGVGYLSTHPDSIEQDFNNNLWIEAESGDLQLPMTSSDDLGASNNKYIVVVPATDAQGNGNNELGSAVYRIYAPVAGIYRLWLRVLAPSGVSNSCYVSAAGSQEYRWDFEANATEWRWRSPANHSFTLVSGFNDMVIRNRESGTRIDKILLSRIESYTPTGEGDETQPFSFITNASGLARTEITFGTTTGPVQVTATGNVPNGSPQVFTVYAQALDPLAMQYNSPQNYPGVAGNPLDIPFSVMLKDPYNNTCSGIPVDFEIISGDGTFNGGGIDSTRISTESDGTASITLTLGYQEETIIRASLPDFPAISPLEFHGIAGEGIPVAIQVTSGQNQTAIVKHELPQPLQVLILDEKNDPVQSYPVPFIVIKGNGLLDGETSSKTVKTNAAGLASVTFTLGDTAGVEHNIVMVDVPLPGAPLYFKPIAIPDSPWQLVKISGDGQQKNAGKLFNDPLVVRITDRYMNGIEDYHVKFTVVTGNGNFSGNEGTMVTGDESTVITDSTGAAQISYTAGSIEGVNSIRVEGLPAVQIGSPETFALTVLPRQPNLINKRSGDNPQQIATVNNLLSEPFKVRLLDPFGNSMSSGIKVVFKVTSGGGKFANLDSTIIETNSSGEAEAYLRLGITAGSQTVRVYLLNYQQVAPVSFTAIAVPDAAVRIISATANPFTFKAGYSPIPLQVKIVDQYENPNPGHAVQFKITQGNGKLEGNVTTLTVNSNNQGIAGVNYQIGTNVSVTNLITATSLKTNTQQQLTNSPITFRAFVTPDTASQIVKISGDTPVQQGQIGSLLPDSLVVQIRDQYNNPIPNQSVSFQVLSATGLIGNKTESDRITDENGNAYVFYTLGFTAGVASDSVRVVIKNRADIAPVIFKATALAGAPEKIFAWQDSTWPGLVLSNNPILLSPKVIVRDIRNNAVTNALVTFKIKRGLGKVNNKDSVNVYTGANGIASVNWTLSSTPDTNLVQAISRYNGAPLSNSPVIFTAVTMPGVPFYLQRKSAENDTGIANQRLSAPLQVRVTDQFQHVIANHPVQFTITFPESGAKGKFILENDSQVESATVYTNNEGYAQIYFKPVTGINSVKASSQYNSVKLQSDQTFYITGTAPQASYIDLLSAQEITAVVNSNQKINVQVGAYDAVGSPVDKHGIHFKILKGSGYLESTKSLQSYISTRNGVAEEKWLPGTVAGAENWLEISSTYDQVHITGSPDTVRLTLLPAAPDPDSSRITATSNIIANGTDYSLITVTVKDKYNNPIPNLTVTLVSENQGVSIENPQTPTNANGITTGKVRSTVSTDTVRVTAHIAGTPPVVICCAQIVFTPDRAGKVVAISGNGQTGNKGAALKHPFIAKVTDNNNNPVAGVDIKFETEQGGGYHLDTGQQSYTVKSDANGMVSALWALGPDNGTNLVAATIKSMGQSSPKALFTCQAKTPQPPYSLFIVSGNNANVAVTDTMTSPLVAGLVDADTGAVFNAPVTWKALNQGGAFAETNPVATNSRGHAQIHYIAGAQAGQQFVQANAANAGNALTFTVNAISAMASDLVAVSATSASDTVGHILPDTMIVRALDQHSNPVANVPVVFQIADAPADNHYAQMLPQDSVITDQNGLAKIRFKIGRPVGDYVVTATSPQIPDVSVLFQVNAVHGPAARLHKYSGDGQYMTKNRTLIYPAVALVTDEFGNSVENEVVYFQPKNFIGSVTSQKDTTDSLGRAGTFWQLGNQAENALWASKPGMTPNHVEFTATGVENAFPEFIGLTHRDTVDYTLDGYNVIITARDDDNDPLTYTIVQKPANSTFNPATRQFSWQPKSNQKKTWNIVFKVEDNKSGVEKGFDIDSLVVTVTGNLPPRIVSYFPANLNINVTEDRNEKFTVLATDPDDDPLLYTWYVDDDACASGAEFTFIAAEHPGVHSLTCMVSDGQDSVEVKWDRVTKIELTSFSASHTPYQGISVNWQTRKEEHNLGFFVYRSMAEKGDYIKMNEKLIAPEKDCDYTYTDTTAADGRRYYYKLVDVNSSGVMSENGPVMAETSLPRDFQLYQNFPNPFNPTTKIRFELPREAQTQITIYNVNGQVVKTLVNSKFKPGYHEITWNGLNEFDSKVSSGIYYLQIQAGRYKDVKKMAFIK